MKLLSLTESIKLVKKYGVQFAPSRQAGTAEEAARAAEELGFPVALKLISSKISHKTDIGGVALNIENSAGARKAFARMRKLRGFKGVLVQKMVRGKEIIIGGKRDEQFGPTILFGLGGIFVEVFKDYTVRVCPITVRDAREMVQGIKAYPILAGFRSKKGVNIKAIEKDLLKVNRLLMKEKNIRELDINPLIASAKGVTAVDARVVVD
ncbi:MAG: acetyl-CoA synthetase I subunit beta [archaeon GW2011_AR10]|uniref:Acetyl-CoA synthetase n=1 Tax=Candidatus Iainarchaeum sp. TaxID=3101447 RepID=A0A7J4IR76_9ARCH|nr:MAG: acetyl-CoA synthetase I subunit beta [archaeon GW2011_AR10]HIH07988.1 acetyl-CoA synthetase [Candidatus Diapherotrites archaeon]